jgi:imidazolonepropionase-like amidohydrolase
MERPVVVYGDLLWDGTDRPPISDGVVVIRGEEIVEVGLRHRVVVPAEPDVQTMVYAGCTILPGLIDPHVHLIWPGDGTPAHTFTRGASDTALLLTAVRNAQMALCAGVTTLRDLGSRGRIVVDLRDAVNDGLIRGPRILASGPPITISGGHMYYLGGEADTAGDVRRMARSNWRMGVDVFKMVLNGGGTPRTHPWIPAYGQHEIDAAVAEARDHEAQLIAHANSTEAIRRGVMAGVSGVEHCTFLRGPGDVLFDARLVEEIVQRGVYIGHTLQAGYQSLQRAHERWSEIPTAERAQWDTRQRVLDAQMDNCAKLLDMGALVVASTDAGWSLNRFGEYWIGMELMVRAGATPLQALAAGTRIAAEGIGLGDKLGRLASGKIADLAVFAGDPTAKISDLRNVRAVLRSGRLVAQDGGLSL